MRGCIGAGRCEPGGGVAEVESAGAVEGFFGGSGWLAAGQVVVLVVVVAGAVDRESPGAGVADVAEPAQRQFAAVGQFPGDVGELAAEAHVDAGELGPALAGAVAGPFPEAGLRGGGRAGPQPLMAAPGGRGGPGPARGGVVALPRALSLGR